MDHVQRALGGEIGWVGQGPDRAAADGQIVARIAAGDRPALAELYARYRQPLFRYLLQLTPDHQLAEEILQDTLVAVWQNARGFEARSRVRTWLFGIARRQAHNALRRRGLPLADAAALEELAAADPEPEPAALASAERAELARALGRLPAIHREVLLLIFVEELSYQEAARVLGVPTGTVKSRLSHARRALRAILRAAKEAE